MSGPERILAGLRILVVEDEPLIAMELIDNLEDVGAAPFGPVMTVAGALSIVRSGEPLDAALLNVNLRGEASFPVADALIERGVPFLFVTGNDAFVRERYPRVPRHPKPAHMPVLIEALGQLLHEQD